MTTATEGPPPPGWWVRRKLASAQADAIRIEARERAAADARLVHAQAEAAEATSAELAMVSAHNERMRLAEEETIAAELAERQARKQAVAVDGNILSATDRGDRLWAIVLTIPLLSGTTAAMFGQIAAFYPHFVPFAEHKLDLEGSAVSLMAFGIAFVIGLTLETLGLYMARLAHKARLRKDSPALYRAVMWAIVLFAATVNYREWSPGWRDPSMLGVIFASLSIGSVLGWELREHRADRDRRAAEIAALGWAPTPIPPRPEFGMARWIVATRHTYTAWVAAVEERIPNADAALQRANDILAKRRESARVARQVEQAAVSPKRLPVGRRLRVLLTGKAPASVLANADLSRFDVDVFGNDLPDIPRQRAVASRREAPALTARQEPARPEGVTGEQEVDVPPPTSRPRTSPASHPARSTRTVVAMDTSEEDAPLRIKIQAYRDANDGAWPSADRCRKTMETSHRRASRVLAAMQTETSRVEVAG